MLTGLVTLVVIIGKALWMAAGLGAFCVALHFMDKAKL